MPIRVRCCSLRSVLFQDTEVDTRQAEFKRYPFPQERMSNTPILVGTMVMLVQAELFQH